MTRSPARRVHARGLGSDKTWRRFAQRSFGCQTALVTSRRRFGVGMLIGRLFESSSGRSVVRFGNGIRFAKNGAYRFIGMLFVQILGHIEDVQVAFWLLGFRFGRWFGRLRSLDRRLMRLLTITTADRWFDSATL